VVPLYFGWTEVVGIRPDGALVRWAAEPEYDYDGVKPIDDPSWCALALVRAVEDHPVLASLMPARPGEVPDCHTCAGTGRNPGWHEKGVICDCSGLGWVARSLQDLGVIVE
jgi:hypothetical protein